MELAAAAKRVQNVRSPHADLVITQNWLHKLLLGQLEHPKWANKEIVSVLIRSNCFVSNQLINVDTVRHVGSNQVHLLWPGS